MSSITEMILIGGVFFIILVTLVLLLVYGSAAFKQFDVIGENLSNAFNSVLTTFVGITSSVITSITAFATTAVQMFSSTGVQVASVFNNVTDYIRDQLSSLITSVGGTVIRLGSQVARTVGGGLLSLANASLQLYNTIGLLVVQIVQFVTNIFVSAFAFTMGAITSGLSFLAKYLALAINFAVSALEAVIDPIADGVNDIINFLENFNPF